MVIDVLDIFSHRYKNWPYDCFEILEKNFKDLSYTPPEQEFGNLKKEYKAYYAIVNAKAEAEAELKKLEKKRTDISNILNEAKKNGLNSRDDFIDSYDYESNNPTLFKWSENDAYDKLKTQDLLSEELEKIDAASEKVDAAIEALNTEPKKLKEKVNKDLEEWNAKKEKYMSERKKAFNWF